MFFEQKETGAYNYKFNDLGFQSTLFINNLGTFGVMFFLYFMALIVLRFLKFCRNKPSIERVRMKMKDKLMISYFITTMVESS